MGCGHGAAAIVKKDWWTWTGSNRRPLPCHLRNINHLQPFPPETKHLARGPVDSGGRHWAPLGRLDATRTPGLHQWLARGVLSCACGCRLLYLLSAEGDNNRFPYKDDGDGDAADGARHTGSVIDLHLHPNDPRKILTGRKWSLVEPIGGSKLGARDRVRAPKGIRVEERMALCDISNRRLFRFSEYSVRSAQLYPPR